MKFLDLGRRAQAERSDLEAAFAAVLDGGRFVGGPALERFEREFAAYCGAAHCVGVNSGTDALALGLRAIGVGPGDEVITAANTCVATITGIAGSGATPVLADVDPETWTLDPGSVERAVTERTKAVVPVHLYGRLAGVEYGLPVLEDSAQAHGRRSGVSPHGAAFSFYPTKNLGALGDAGAFVTDDPEAAERARMLRSHGERADARGVGVVPGVNSRLDEVQAEILCRRLARLEEGNARRRELAAHYLGDLRGVTLPVADQHSWHLFVVLVDDRDAFRARLRERGVETLVHYPAAIHRQPAWAHLAGDVPLTVSERLCDQVVSLPLYPELTDSEAEQVVAAVNG